jgi:hypothetical protein
MNASTAAAILVGALVIVGAGTYEVLGTSSGVVSTSTTSLADPSPVSVLNFTLTQQGNATLTLRDNSTTDQVALVSMNFDNASLSINPPNPFWEKPPVPANSTATFSFQIEPMGQFPLRVGAAFSVTFTFELYGTACMGPQGLYACGDHEYLQTIITTVEVSS